MTTACIIPAADAGPTRAESGGLEASDTDMGPSVPVTADGKDAMPSLIGPLDLNKGSAIAPALNINLQTG
jgi:hypothetical protein